MKEILSVAGLVTIVGLAGFLTEDKQYEVVSCTTEYSKFWVAEYSDSGIDFDGNPWSEYWEEVASDTNTVITVNGSLYHPRNPNFVYYMSEYGYFIPKDPPQRYNYNFDTGYKFDGFKVKINTEFKSYLVSEEDSTEISFRHSDYEKCVESLDTVVTVGTWYGYAHRFKFKK